MTLDEAMKAHEAAEDALRAELAAIHAENVRAMAQCWNVRAKAMADRLLSEARR